MGHETELNISKKDGRFQDAGFYIARNLGEVKLCGIQMEYMKYM